MSKTKRVRNQTITTNPSASKLPPLNTTGLLAGASNFSQEYRETPRPDNKYRSGIQDAMDLASSIKRGLNNEPNILPAKPRTLDPIKNSPTTSEKNDISRSDASDGYDSVRSNKIILDKLPTKESVTETMQSSSSVSRSTRLNANLQVTRESVSAGGNRTGSKAKTVMSFC